MKKFNVLFALFVSIFFLFGCEKDTSQDNLASEAINQEQNFITSDLIAQITDPKVKETLKQIAEGTYKSPTFSPPRDGIAVSEEGYLVFKSEDVFDNFVMNLNYLTNIKDLNEWEKSLGFESIRQSGKWRKEHSAEKYEYPFNDLLTSTIVNNDGYVMIVDVLYQITDEGKRTRQKDGTWHFEKINWEIQESEASLSESKSGCISNGQSSIGNDCNPNSCGDIGVPYRFTGETIYYYRWWSSYRKVYARASFDKRQDCYDGPHLCDYPADFLMNIVSASGNGVNGRITRYMDNSSNLDTSLYLPTNCVTTINATHIALENDIFYVVISSL